MLTVNGTYLQLSMRQFPIRGCNWAKRGSRMVPPVKRWRQYSRRLDIGSGAFTNMVYLINLVGDSNRSENAADPYILVFVSRPVPSRDVFVTCPKRAHSVLLVGASRISMRIYYTQ